MPILGMITFSPSLDKRKSHEKLIFGTWGSNGGNRNTKIIEDFLHSLSRIDIPNPLPLIPIPWVEEGSIDQGT